MTIPSRDLPRVVWRRILRELRARTAPRTPRRIEIGASVQEIAAQLPEREAPRFFAMLPEHAALIAQFFPAARAQTLDEAEAILAHRFDLLGSGPVEMGERIDWHTDFKHDHTWPLEHHTRLTLTAPGGGFDVKVPWELSRFHHGLRLGQAYLYTLDERYARELVAQITDWVEANPVEFGVNWAGPMDVAIRAVNWVWAVFMILHSEAATPDFLALWLTSLREHGDYLIKNLEDGWPRTNHLIANLVGLAYLGILFPEFPQAARWREVGLGRLWQELERQVNPDGMDYEASTSYHRLVTEMALSVAALCAINEIDVPGPALARLSAMVDVIAAYMQPDGTAPVIGDADDGRLHPLSVHPDPTCAVLDHRHLLALGSLVLEREAGDWAGYADPRRRGWAIAAGDEWQDAFWFFSQDAAARFVDTLAQTTPRPPDCPADGWVEARPGVRLRASALSPRPISRADVSESRGFEASGLYVLRHGDCQLTLVAGGVGQDGAGGHAHNDTLSFTLCAYRRTFLVDPGTYVYTSQPAARNLFRATASHNTLQVSGAEINPLPAELFRLPGEAQVTLHRWIVQPTFDLVDASHNGYARLEPGAIHRRQVWFDKQHSLWLLHDHLEPADAGDEGREVAVTLWFHFAPLSARLDAAHNAVRTEEIDGPNLALLPLGRFPLQADLVSGWVSPRYGVRRQAPVAKFTGRVKLPADLVLLLYPQPGEVDLDAARAAGREALARKRQTLTPIYRGGD